MAYYHLNGEEMSFRLNAGQTKFNIEVPAVGGELMIGGTEKMVALVYVKKVTDAKIDNSMQLNETLRKKIRVIVRADQRETSLEFLTSKEARFPVSWAKFPPGSRTTDVYIAPGRYWVRRNVIGIEHLVVEEPFTEVEISGQVELEFP